MLISRKIDYALRCLLYLAKEDWVSTAKLSRELRIPRVFLTKILQILTRYKILESKKGKVGGVRLRRKKVNLFEVIKILDPGFSLIKCLRKGYHCFLKKECVFYKLLKGLESEMFRKLKKINFVDLVQKGVSNG